jgi:hypothetical protein
MTELFHMDLLPIPCPLLSTRNILPLPEVERTLDQGVDHFFIGTVRKLFIDRQDARFAPAIVVDEDLGVMSFAEGKGQACVHGH